MEKYLISYSTKGFYRRHNELNISARKFGIKNIISYKDSDLFHLPFYKENYDVLSNPKGAGFWLWKPFFIYEALKEIKEGDILFYVDAASIFIDSPEVLFNICDRDSKGVMTFDARPITNGEYCRRDAFINMDADSPKYWDAFQSIATMILFKKNDFSMTFVKEWLKECMNPYNIVNNNNSSHYLTQAQELNKFVDHRSDQSVLSILVTKYNLETYRNPTKWGNYLKLPEFRIPGELVCYPFLLKNIITDYANSPMQNSPYPTIFIINRGRDLTQKEIILNKINNLKRALKSLVKLFIGKK